MMHCLNGPTHYLLQQMFCSVCSLVQNSVPMGIGMDDDAFADGAGGVLWWRSATLYSNKELYT